MRRAISANCYWTPWPIPRRPGATRHRDENTDAYVRLCTNAQVAGEALDLEGTAAPWHPSLLMRGPAGPSAHPISRLGIGGPLATTRTLPATRYIAEGTGEWPGPLGDSPQPGDRPPAARLRALGKLSAGRVVAQGRAAKNPGGPAYGGALMLAPA
jgi:hypothetical protein